MSLLPRELLRFLRPIPSSQSLPSRRSLSTKINVIDELESRGMVAELTSRAIRKHVDKKASVYLGVDPSAASLHVGNLLALIGLLHFRLQGHNAIALIGGATGSVGDPSGRSTERNALSSSDLSKNSKAITKQVTSFLTRGLPFATSRTSPRYSPTTLGTGEEIDTGSVTVVNNLEWLGGVGLLEFLTKVGKFARMGTMLSKESVKSRLDSNSGLSFTEFSYQLLQAYDFLTLHQKHGCTIQLGGSDQLGNIMSGIELIRRTRVQPTGSAASPLVEESEAKKKEAVEAKILAPVVQEEEDPAYGVTMPLLTTASGEKFGKSAGNAVWLDPKITSPFELYQFFLRTSDEEVEKYLSIFSFIRVVELKSIVEVHKANPTARVAQKILAAEATELVHGPVGLRQALSATTLFYSPRETSPITDEMIESLDATLSLSDPQAVAGGCEIPSLLVRLRKEDVVGSTVESLVIASGLFATKNQTRKAIEAGTISLNGVKLPPRKFQLTVKESDLEGGKLIVLKVGKSVYRVVLADWVLESVPCPPLSLNPNIPKRSNTSTLSNLPGVGVGIGADNSLPRDAFQTVPTPPQDTSGQSNINTDSSTPTSAKQQVQPHSKEEATLTHPDPSVPLAETATGIRTSTETTNSTPESATTSKVDSTAFTAPTSTSSAAKTSSTSPVEELKVDEGADRDGALEATVGGEEALSKDTYPEQKHAGKVGFGPNYHSGPSVGEKLKAELEIAQGKLLKKPELIEKGELRKAGELEKKRGAAKDAESARFSLLLDPPE